MQPNPNPSSNPPPDPYYSSHFSYYSQNLHISLPFPLVHPDPPETSSATDLKPPGVDSYPSVTPVSQVTQAPALTYAQPDVASAAYYFDPNSQAVLQYGADSTGYIGAVVSVAQEGLQQLAVAPPSSTLWSNYVYQPQGNENLNKRQKKTKLVQSAYCEVCKIDCNSKEVLDNHRLGKKHKKNLEKLLAAAAGPSVSSVVSHHPIGPRLNPKKVTPAKNKATKPLEDLETKRRKIVEGGAAQEAVRVCAICNVVCNSQGVYNFHLAGKKHATMLKKYMGGVSLVTAT